MTSNLKLSSLAVAAACPGLPAASYPTGSAAAGLSGLAVSALSGSRLRGTGLAGFAMPILAAREADGRPTQAPAAVVAQAQAYVSVAANGAEHRTEWTDGVPSFFEGGADVETKAQQKTKRALRGLEPWRDPA